jgi:hypothetical protein
VFSVLNTFRKSKVLRQLRWSEALEVLTLDKCLALTEPINSRIERQPGNYPENGIVGVRDGFWADCRPPLPNRVTAELLVIQESTSQSGRKHYAARVFLKNATTSLLKSR